MKVLNVDDVSYINAVRSNNLDIVHKQNYNRMPEFLIKYFYNDACPNNSNIIEHINYLIKDRLFDTEGFYKDTENNRIYFQFYYNLLSYILKTDVKFDIEYYKKHYFFIDIILHKYLDYFEGWHYDNLKTKDYTKDYIQILKEGLLSFTYDLLDDIISILNLYYLQETAFFNLKLLNDFFGGELNKHYIDTSENEILMDTIKNESLLKYNDKEYEKTLLSKKEEEESLKTTPKPIEATTIAPIDNNSTIYKAIHKDLSDYITYASPEKYKDIIENNNFGTQTKKYIKLQKEYDSHVNLKRFAFIFELELSDIKNIFKGKDVNKLKSVSLKENEKKTDFYDALISVRNSHLNKINPQKYPKIE